MATGGVYPKSVLAAESPPFNPQQNYARTGSGVATYGAGGGMASPPHGGGGHRSRSNSPYPSRSPTRAPLNVATTTSSVAPPVAPNANSNAVAKYTFQSPSGETLEIRNVWAENVEQEMAALRSVVEKYPYVAMDTEFPGVVAKPISESYTADYHYKSLEVNVDLLKIIQLGLSFADEQGNFAPGCPCWQFNFQFSLEDDMYAQDSIDLLQKSGISFEDHAKRGIDPLLFGELLMVSGLVLDDRVKWVSFHSGYDYGYLLKLLTTQHLPKDEKGFFELLKIYFPTIYDIKYMTSILDGYFSGGLQKLADDLKCQRLGAEHQAGSDSLLTMNVYFALSKAKFMTGSAGADGKPTIDDSKYANELFGYGNNHTVRKTPGGGGGGVGASAFHRDVSKVSTASNSD